VQIELFASRHQTQGVVEGGETRATSAAIEIRSSVAERYNSCRQYQYNVGAHISLEQPDETPDPVPAR
jgi:hypothetical protein